MPRCLQNMSIFNMKYTRSFYNDPSEIHEYLRMVLRVYTKLADGFGCGQTAVKPHGHRGLTSKLPRYNLGQTFK